MERVEQQAAARENKAREQAEQQGAGSRREGKEEKKERETR